MTAMRHDQVQEALGAYVLGAMPAEELAEMRAHIMSCEECMRDADQLSEAATSFGVSAGTVPLPAGFSERVLDQVRSERAQPSPTPEKRRWGSILAGATAAVVALASLAALATTRADLDRKDEILAAVLHGEGLDLRGSSGAVGKIAASSSGTLFAVAGMQPAPDDHDYQLWLIRDGQPTSAGTFDIEDGIGIVETELPLDDFEAAAVTIERDGGADQPTGDPVLTST